MESEHRVIAITGASKGIGAQIARRYGALGCAVYVTYRTDEAGARTVAAQVEEAGGVGHVVALDVKDEASVRHLYDEIDRDHGCLDVLVSSAVQEIAKTIEDATFDEWHTVLLTKLDGAFLNTKYALPLLKRSKNGSVVYITSFDGEMPDGDYIGYQTGTAGLIGLAKAMAVYLPRFGIRANALSPGAVRTPLWDALGGEDESMWAGFAKRNPMGRIATTEDVADACVFLTEDPHRFINGNFLYVDGGARWKTG